MNPLRAIAQSWLQQKVSAMIVTVSASEGSTPRETGASMLVSATAQAGTIGGGNLEWQACAQARQQLANLRGAVRPGSLDTDTPPAIEQRVALGPSLGQCCGGVVWLRFEHLSATTLSAWPDRAALFHLQLFGAGHVGSALVRTLAPLACAITWYDHRAQHLELARTQTASHDDVAHVRVVECDEHGGAFAQGIAASDLVLVMTHRHDLDLAICADVLRKNHFGFLGLIGSTTKRARFARRLAQAGISAEAITRLNCPLAPATTRCKEPAALAIVIAAQLLQITASKAAATPRRAAPAQTIDALA